LRFGRLGLWAAIRELGVEVGIVAFGGGVLCRAFMGQATR
jgi:hypothetical protein